MTRSETSTSMAAEYLVLLRQLAAAQRRATTLAEALARLQRQRAAEEARWSAALADRDALIAGLWQRLRGTTAPTLAQRLAACWRRLEQHGTAPDTVRAAACSLATAAHPLTLLPGLHHDDA